MQSVNTHMIKTIKTAHPAEVLSSHIFADVLLNKETNQRSLHSAAVFFPGDVICAFGANSVQTTATYLTVQTDADRHITLTPEFLQYINHSCSPTVFFDTALMQLFCLRQVQPGDEFTFFYPSTEWEMAQPFVCNCGSVDCIQLVNGASHLSVATLSAYKLTDFIKKQLRQKLCL